MLEEQFGGAVVGGQTPRTNSAYMLVYVLASDWGRIMAPVSSADAMHLLNQHIQVGALKWGASVCPSYD